jgi:hypothetical protein
VDNETKAAPDVVAQLLEIFKGAEQDYEADDYKDPDELFREAIATEWPKGTRWPKGKKGFRDCGSAGRWDGKIKISDTPRGLYRLLYLVRPKKVDFSDMYKSEMFRFFSKDLRFMVIVYLFKYELSLYFYCRADLVEDKQAGQAIRVIAGAPGSNNGLRCTNEEGRKFFEMVARAAKFKWMVYGGNDFEV